MSKCMLEEAVKRIKGKKPKIMFWDIETSPNLILDFSCGFNKSVLHGQVLEERKIVGICYKYLGKDKVHHMKWDVKGKGVDAKRCDRELVRKFGKVLMDCDVAVAHNGDGFDYKWLKGRTLFHRLPPIGGVQTIDTYKLSRSNFNLNSQKLDYLSQFLFRKHKLITNFSLWKDVWLGKKDRLKYMMDYCEVDVILLEDVFKEILPYCETLPFSMAILLNGSREECTVCGSSNRMKAGFKYAKIGKRQKYICKECGNPDTDSRLYKEPKK